MLSVLFEDECVNKLAEIQTIKKWIVKRQKCRFYKCIWREVQDHNLIQLEFAMALIKSEIFHGKIDYKGQKSVIES